MIQVWYLFTLFSSVWYLIWSQSYFIWNKKWGITAWLRVALQWNHEKWHLPTSKNTLHIWNYCLPRSRIYLRIAERISVVWTHFAIQCRYFFWSFIGSQKQNNLFHVYEGLGNMQISLALSVPVRLFIGSNINHSLCLLDILSYMQERHTNCPMNIVNLECKP